MLSVSEYPGIVSANLSTAIDNRKYVSDDCKGPLLIDLVI